MKLKEKEKMLLAVFSFKDLCLFREMDCHITGCQQLFFGRSYHLVALTANGNKYYCVFAQHNQTLTKVPLTVEVAYNVSRSLYIWKSDIRSFISLTSESVYEVCLPK